jgi:hypothetical protein
MTRNKKASDAKELQENQGSFTKMQTPDKWSVDKENKGRFLKRQWSDGDPKPQIRT